MSVDDFVSSVPGFYEKNLVDKLLVLAWYVQARQGKTHFDSAHLRACFRDAGVEPPDLSVYLPRLAAKKPPQVVKEGRGYRLAAPLRRELDLRLGESPTTVAVAKSLTDLPAQVPDIVEREFLDEAIKCYRVSAYRAAIVMVWNLAYDHMVRWICIEPSRLSALNAGIAVKYPKKTLAIVDVEGASELKESEFIEAARTARLIDKNVAQILREKLGRRNMAAHPSRVVITQHSADDMITDLVANVIIKHIW